MSNHLVNASSRYLLQHADNPVDWYPWSQEALAKAREEDKPIFLSIGYSACHWCHVMAHESFEDPRVAAILNAHFVSIKVDREERPDLDRIYMTAVQALTGNGGWPMSVFLTPQGQPFYGGTYFPPTPRYGLPSFTQVLLAIAEAWQERRPELLQSGQQLQEFITRSVAPPQGAEGRRPLEGATLDLAVERLAATYDATHGGWGQAPKFPQPMTLEFLLRRHNAQGDPRILEMVTHTLDAMARGGIYDQLGGGFHRYAVDRQWLVPHFEKMLYDNAQLARLYLHVWQVTGDPLYRAIAEETLDYVAREMTHPAGGFYATQDADSEGEEGRFFLWDLEEVQAILEADAARFIAAYGVTEEGNFEGRNILSLIGDLAEREALTEARRRLFAARQERLHPGRDEKVLTSWNGLMLAAFAEAARVLGRADYRRIAARNATFILDALRTPSGLVHVWKDGQLGTSGFLEDYAHLIEGLLALYATTFEERWYVAAHDLLEEMMARFSAPDGFYDTPADHEALIVRPRDLQDNAVPSGSAMACGVLLQMAVLAAEPRYEVWARQLLRDMQPLLGEHPLAFGQWLIALDDALAPHQEVAIVGEPTAPDTQALLGVCQGGYAPHRIVAAASTGEAVPLLRDRPPLEGRATAYLCQGQSCRPPVTTPAALAALLKG